MTKNRPHYGEGAQPPNADPQHRHDHGHRYHSSGQPSQEGAQQQNYPHPLTTGLGVEHFKAHFDRLVTPQVQNDDSSNPQQQHGLTGEAGETMAGTRGAAFDSLVAESRRGDRHKEHNKYDKHKKNEQRRQKKRNSQHMGDFSITSTNIWLEHEQYLVADCKDVNGNHHQSRIDLDGCLANHDGEFKWVSHGNFKASAKDIKLKDDGTKLKAKLRAVNGDWEVDSVRLNERIGNDNGRLFFIE